MHVPVTSSGVNPINQASKKFSLVPDLPATGRSPSEASFAIPSVTSPTMLERTARLAPALGDEVELGILVPVADPYRPWDVSGPLAPTRSLLVSAGHGAGILHYGDTRYIRITRRLRSVNEGLSRAPNDLQERCRCDPTGGARPPPRWWRDIAGKTRYRPHGP